jgi:hypothetical protein
LPSKVAVQWPASVVTTIGISEEVGIGRHAPSTERSGVYSAFPPSGKANLVEHARQEVCPSDCPEPYRIVMFEHTQPPGAVVKYMDSPGFHIIGRIIEPRRTACAGCQTFGRSTRWRLRDTYSRHFCPPYS